MYVYQLCIYIQSSECIAEAVPLQVLYPTKFFHVALGLVKSKRQSWFRQRSYTIRFTEKIDQAVPNDLPLYSRIGSRSQQLRQRPARTCDGHIGTWLSALSVASISRLPLSKSARPICLAIHIWFYTPNGRWNTLACEMHSWVIHSIS